MGVPDPSSASEGDALTTQASYERNPAALARMLGLCLVGLACVAAFLWLGPPLTETWRVGNARSGARGTLRMPDFSSMLLYAGFLILGVASVGGLVGVAIGLVRGMAMARCPACGTNVLVGADRRVPCTGCGRTLDVVPARRSASRA